MRKTVTASVAAISLLFTATPPSLAQIVDPDVFASGSTDLMGLFTPGSSDPISQPSPAQLSEADLQRGIRELDRYVRFEPNRVVLVPPQQVRDSLGPGVMGYFERSVDELNRLIASGTIPIEAIKGSAYSVRAGTDQSGSTVKFHWWGFETYLSQNFIDEYDEHLGLAGSVGLLTALKQDKTQEFLEKMLKKGKLRLLGKVGSKFIPYLSIALVASAGILKYCSKKGQGVKFYTTWMTPLTYPPMTYSPTCVDRVLHR